METHKARSRKRKIARDETIVRLFDKKKQKTITLKGYQSELYERNLLFKNYKRAHRGTLLKVSALERHAVSLTRKARKPSIVLETETKRPRHFIRRSHLEMVIKIHELLSRQSHATAPCPLLVKVPLNVKYNDRLPSSRRRSNPLKSLLCRETALSVVISVRSALINQSMSWRMKWWSLVEPKNQHTYLVIAFRHADILTEVL